MKRYEDKYTDDLLRRIFEAEGQCEADVKNRLKKRDFYLYEESDKECFIKNLMDDCFETEEEALEDWESLHKATVDGVTYYFEIEC